MADATGKVSCVQVGDDFCFTAIQNGATSQLEVYILWWDPGDIPVVDRIRLSMWLAMLRDAMSRCLDVTVVHDDDSANVLTLQLDD
jgi:hypothetical protein